MAESVWLYPVSKEYAEERAAELRAEGHNAEVRRTGRKHPTDVYEVIVVVSDEEN